ncbi:hypothetical protein OB905_12415 [Halobacteria archaeon AArc-dxtr1]|nr:hypothetical protein [Halobacteria archaeon AArc-dxtr1]
MLKRRGTRVTRRTLLCGLGASASGGLAGCFGDDDGGSEDDDGNAIDPDPVDVAADATWRTAMLEDVTGDAEFRIDEFDRPTVVHTFAIGCAVCASQHDQFAALYEQEDVEIVDLTTDPYESREAVRDHADEEGFDWRFGIAPDAVIGSLVGDFDQEVTSSAASPVIVVCPGGQTYRLEKVVDAEALASVLTEHC